MKTKTTKKAGIWIFILTLFMVHVFFRSNMHADEGAVWRETQAKDGECCIAFPTTPQLMSQAIDLPEGEQLVYDVYLSPFDTKGVFLLLVATYPFSLNQAHEVAGVEGLLKGIIGHHPDNVLVFSELTEVGGQMAMNFLVQNGVNYFRGQAFMKGNKLFLIAMEGKKEFLEERTFLRFASSFRLTKP